MAGRIEYKYLVPNALLPRLRSEVLPHVVPDLPPGSTSADYTVRSVYFDTPHLDCYEEKADGLKMRNKFRVRGYGRDGTKSSVVFLEIKRKCEAFIKKHRAPLAPEDVEAFLESRDIDRYIAGDTGPSREKEDALRFLYHYGRHGLRPTVLVVYDREAFKGRFDSSLRITFDKNVRGTPFPSLDGLFADDGLRAALPGSFILEVKFFRYALPHWVRSLVERHELRRLALSKYAMCIESAGSDQARWLVQRRMHAVLRSSA
jgi:VTC domain-containing protein